MKYPEAISLLYLIKGLVNLRETGKKLKIFDNHVHAWCYWKKVRIASKGNQSINYPSEDKSYLRGENEIKAEILKWQYIISYYWNSFAKNRPKYGGNRLIQGQAVPRKNLQPHAIPFSTS